MLDDAKKTVDDLGYSLAFARRFARMSDISIRDVLFANRDAVPFMKKDNDIFGELSKQTVQTAKNMKFDKVEEISVDNFLENILPKATELSLYLESNLTPNFVSLTTSEDETAKPLFKWGNSVSHVYNGNVTGGYEPKLIIIIPSYLFTVLIGAELKLANTLAKRATPC